MRELPLNSLRMTPRRYEQPTLSLNGGHRCCRHTDSLHNYCTTSKLEHESEGSKCNFLNNECGLWRDIYESKTLIYALLMTGIPAPCSDYFFHTFWHTVNQVV